MVVKHFSLIAACERMRALRQNPEVRKRQAEASRSWRSNPENAQKRSEQKRRCYARMKERLKVDAAYREHQNRKARERMQRMLSDPVMRDAILEQRRKARDRINSDNALKARELSYSRNWRKLNRERKRAYASEWKKRNPQHRAAQRIRNAVRRAIKGAKVWKSAHYLGISIDGARRHIESMFPPGWTWENQGTVWHIDHIYPIGKANLDDHIEVLAVCNYKNLRPLSVEDNQSKGDSITPEARRLFEQLKAEAAATIPAMPPAC